MTNTGGCQHGQPGVDAVGGSQDTGNIGTQTEKTGLTEGNLTGITEQKVQGQSKHGMDADKNHDIEQVAFMNKQWRQDD